MSMGDNGLKEMAEFIYQDLRLTTLPVAAKFYKQEPSWPAKTRRPAQVLEKRITICQAMTLARLYRWTVGLTVEDLVCAPALLAFGHAKTDTPKEDLAAFFSRVGWCADEAMAGREVDQMAFMPKGKARAMVLAPLNKGLFEPDTVTIYGNPAQIMRIVQAWTYSDGNLVKGQFGGKVSCTEYLIAPLLSGEARVALPGNGDRIMSITQDNEMAFALPGAGLSKLVQGLKQAGRSLGARYPVSFYQNFQPEYPASVYNLEVEVDD